MEQIGVSRKEAMIASIDKEYDKKIGWTGLFGLVWLFLLAFSYTRHWNIRDIVFFGVMVLLTDIRFYAEEQERLTKKAIVLCS